MILSKNKTVMVVDDDTAIVEVIQLMLEDEGYNVKTSLDEEVINDTKLSKPDLILLDIWMTKINGNQICKHLRDLPEFKHIPIILVSANRDTKSLALDAGANDFIAKPFDIDDLLSKVAKHIS